jgi:hypothetical protein
VVDEKAAPGYIVVDVPTTKIEEVATVEGLFGAAFLTDGIDANKVGRRISKSRSGPGESKPTTTPLWTSRIFPFGTTIEALYTTSTANLDFTLSHNLK